MVMWGAAALGSSPLFMIQMDNTTGLDVYLDVGGRIIGASMQS